MDGQDSSRLTWNVNLPLVLNSTVKNALRGHVIKNVPLDLGLKKNSFTFQPQKPMSLLLKCSLNDPKGWGLLPIRKF